MSDHSNGDVPRDASRDEIELLLPWYVNGTLKRSDVVKVEAYLQRHPEMETELATLREDMHEAITANEAIAGPGRHALDRLMQQVEAETPAGHRLSRAGRGLIASIGESLRSLTPGRLGWAAMAAAAVMVLQAGLVGTMMLNPPSSGSTYQTASGGGQLSGTFVLLQFKQNASVADISEFLTEHGAEIVAGPKPGGLFRVRVSANELDDKARQGMLEKLRSNDTLLNMVLPSQ